MAQVGTGNQLDIWLIVHPQSSSSRYLSSMAVLEDDAAGVYGSWLRLLVVWAFRGYLGNKGFGGFGP